MSRLRLHRRLGTVPILIEGLWRKNNLDRLRQIVRAAVRSRRNLRVVVTVSPIDEISGVRCVS